MTTIRRTVLGAALAILPALSLGLSAARAAEPAPAGHQISHEMLMQVFQDLPGPEYAEANRLKTEALHGLLMGGDLASAEPKLRAFAAEYSRVSGGDPKGMQDHVMEVGAQIAELAKDPQFRAHIMALHVGR